MNPWPAVVGTALGAIVGSFLAVLAIRWERGETAVRGRSRCDHCGRGLTARELVPIVGYLVARGRCATCRAPIDRRHPTVEAAAALIGGLALGLRPDVVGVAGALFGWALVPLALLDARCLWLPDRLTWPLLAGGLVAGAATVPPALPDRLVGAAAGFASLEILRRLYRRALGRDGLGGGDAKLLAAIGAWLGWQPLPWVVAIASCAGLAWIAWCGRTDPRAFDARLPLGTLLAIAAWTSWIWQAVG